MSYPTQNVHRRNRRSLGRGQQVALPNVSFTPTNSPNTNSVLLTFTSPVVFSGSALSGFTFSGAAPTQTAGVQVSPTTFLATYNPSMATLVGRTWTATSPLPHAQTYQGGGVTGGSGTF